jgi:hypothetical protein
MKYFGDYNEEHGCWNGYWVNGDEIITPKELTQRQNDFEWRPYDSENCEETDPIVNAEGKLWPYSNNEPLAFHFGTFNLPLWQ